MTTHSTFSPAELQRFYAICQRQDLEALLAFLDTAPELFRAPIGETHGPNGPGISPVAWNAHAGWDAGLLALAARPDLVNYNQVDYYGRTVLHWLAIGNSARKGCLMRRFIESIPAAHWSAIDGNMADVTLLTPLHLAARRLDLGATEALLLLPNVDPQAKSQNRLFSDLSPDLLAGEQSKLDPDTASNRIAMYRAMAHNLVLNRMAGEIATQPSEEQIKKMDIYAAI